MEEADNIANRFKVSASFLPRTSIKCEIDCMSKRSRKTLHQQNPFLFSSKGWIRLKIKSNQDGLFTVIQLSPSTKHWKCVFNFCLWEYRVSWEKVLKGNHSSQLVTYFIGSNIKLYSLIRRQILTDANKSRFKLVATELIIHSW